MWPANRKKVSTSPDLARACRHSRLGADRVTWLSKKQKKKRRQKAGTNTEDDQLAGQVESLKVTDETPEKRTAKSKKARRKASKLEESSKNTATEENLPDSVVPTLDSSNVLNGEKNAEDGTGEDLKDAAPSRLDDVQITEEVTATDTQKNGNSGDSKTKTPKVKEILKCNVCHRGYQSRNKLFDHIKQTGHALRAETPEESDRIVEEERGKKGKKKSKR
ncbi:DnaJ sub C member 21 [Bulinus truncatus]|nr:DnaJ sub C member 21 [Bulinus truncatus]